MENLQQTTTIPVVLTGIFVGLSIPPIGIGITNSYHQSIRHALPQWEALLQAYSACILPPFFLLLFSINLAIFQKLKINYVFIFEWNVKSHLHPAELGLISSFLILLLSWAFYVSFTMSWNETIAPTSWPLIWIVVVLIITLNPLPFMYRNSRYWFVRSLIRVFVPGFLAVEVRVIFKQYYLTFLTDYFYLLV